MKKKRTASSESAEIDQPISSAPAVRYLIANRLAGKQSKDLRASSRERFDKVFASALKSSVDILADTSDSKSEAGTTRRVILFEGDREELIKKRSEFGSDIIIEPEALRYPLRYDLVDELTSIQGYFPAVSGLAPQNVSLAAMPLGSGAAFTVKINGEGVALEGVKVILLLSNLANGQTTNIANLTAPDGSVSFNFDATEWTPKLLVVEPKHSFWSAVVNAPSYGTVITLKPLPKSGPHSWWHYLVGSALTYNEAIGQGIKVGVVDTGVGPHPYLAHAKAAGAFIDGGIDTSADAWHDVENHGTHVAGIIGARPSSGSKDFSGIAPGADLFGARVFPPGLGANQGDIASALDFLSTTKEVDLINMSLGGAYSAIEFDAIVAALEAGSVCVCAAGNTRGGAVMFPAAHPQVIAISALGLYGTESPGSTEAANVPNQPDRFAMGGLYLASFSAIGPQIDATAPGNGIISTVPAREKGSTPYLGLDGTSMACPAATGALAAILSADTQYKDLPRGLARSQYVLALARTRCLTLGLNPQYQGAGLVRLS